MADMLSVEKILDVCYKIWYFFIINLLFVCSNIPVLLTFLMLGPDQFRTCLPLVFLALVPTAPALCAVFYAMNRLISGTDRSPLRDYRKGYQDSFLQKISLGMVHMFVLLVFWTNIEFFSLQIPCLPLSMLFVVLFAAGILVTPQMYLMASRYNMTNRQIAGNAIVLLIARPVATLGNTAALAVVLAAYELSAGTAVLFMGSVYGFLVVFMNRRLMESLENRE